MVCRYQEVKARFVRKLVILIDGYMKDFVTEDSPPASLQGTCFLLHGQLV